MVLFSLGDIARFEQLRPSWESQVSGCEGTFLHANINAVHISVARFERQSRQAVGKDQAPSPHGGM